ncbi:stress activated map kinase interacting [Ophiocordyceps camponoti-floridani]|uniref:Stress activated map kinase interacting n=1 Tax=Ophiocordyceps camponoti-floridani TaxID=2030778 RepID=A0A8H4Q9C1_9HYPO|nr:stress activated map kinase interacting [Ophiocordyceps camponoti-floridani]
MALVDYSESEASESETSKPAHRSVSKKSSQRVVDHRGKIIVNLPPPSSFTGDQSSPPPAKRARTSNGLFSGFNALLPPPKRKMAQATSAVVLKTSAEPGFNRVSAPVADDVVGQGPSEVTTTVHEPERRETPRTQPVGTPTMFRPLSVSRKKKTRSVKPTTTISTQHPAAPAPKKQSLFSLHTEESGPEPKTAIADEYSTAPLIDTGHAPIQQQQQPPPDDAPAQPPNRHRLDTIANELDLSPAARRELFGRHGPSSTAATQSVLDFNMDHEYQHNEKLRAAGEQQTHNPVRAIQSGKHNLRQLVHNVQSQREALEDSFAQGKSNRKDASSRYGWR